MTSLRLTAHLGGGAGKIIVSTHTDQHVITIGPITATMHYNVLKEKKQVTSMNFMLEEHRNIIKAYVKNADIVHVDFWNHPLIPYLLTEISDIPTRMLIWCHVSGIHTPIIPKKIDTINHDSLKFLLASPCSLLQFGLDKNKYEVMCNATGTDKSILQKQHTNSKLRVGYIGTTHPVKMHPDYSKFASVLPNTQVSVYGGASPYLDNCTHILQKGFTYNVVDALQEMDIFLYLLNPYHFGTGESALLEAMSMGVIPIVMNNPAEMCIIEHGKNGFIIKNEDDLIEIYNELSTNIELRSNISNNAINTLSRLSGENSKDKLIKMYNILMNATKKTHDFRSVFGNTPTDWFLSFQEFPEYYTGKALPSYYETFQIIHPTKGSLNHFKDYFDIDNSIKLPENCII